MPPLSSFPKWLRPTLTLLSLLVFAGIGGATWFSQLLNVPAASRVPSSASANQAALLGPVANGDTPWISEPVFPTLSRPVRDLPQNVAALPTRLEFERERPGVVRPSTNIADVPDPLAGRVFDQVNTPNPLFTVEGVNNLCNCSPPDTVGDVGPNHYVQMVNATTFSIYTKTGTVLVSNVALSSLWSSGGCSTSANGDPIVVYDPLADRWVLAQFSNGNGICVAVSQTADPTGSYYGYEFNFPSFPDYFKIGVWPGAYLVSANESDYSAAALDRSQMLVGGAATMIRFASSTYTNLFMPSDIDGPTAPPANTPGYFYTFKDNAFHGGADRLEVYEFRPNWITPANSTFVLSATIPITNYTYTVCGFFVLNCIHQSGTAQRVDPVSEWPMFRLPYRNFGTHETLVGNFAVDVGGDRAGIRWFELRKSGAGNWALFQEGTHAPADNLHRWMGSIAMDKNGNIALGYSRSSTTTFPSLYIATRAPGDPAGTLQTEALFFAGTGSQTGNNRWGDYSSMSVDPADDCTFWFTSEYYSTTSSNGWRTRLGAFRMPNCTPGPAPTYGLSLAPAVAGQTGNPGQAVNYTLTLTHTGNVTDTFTVTVTGQTFTVTAPATVGPVVAGASTTFTVSTTLPANALAGLTDIANVNVKSQGDPAQQANITLTTQVAAVYGVGLTPPSTALTTTPDVWITHTLTLTNTGNITDTFNLTLMGQVFTTTAPASVGPLGPGSSQTIAVEVLVPAGTSAGASNAVALTATSQGNGAQTVSATVTTYVIWNNVYLPLVRR